MKIMNTPNKLCKISTNQLQFKTNSRLQEWFTLLNECFSTFF